MNARALVPILAAAVSLAATPASAQRSQDSELALQALRNYAFCVNEHAPSAAVARLLAMDPDSPEYKDALNRFARGFGRCMGGSQRLEFGGLPFAGGLAEAAIAAHYRGRGLAEAVAGVPVSGANSVVQAIGRCVTRAEPAAVTRLLDTEPGSPEETAALQLTGSALPGCIPSGVTLTLNKPAVRAIYALGAYSLLAAQDAAATPQDVQ